jgi:hypothetical protein
VKPLRLRGAKRGPTTQERQTAGAGTERIGASFLLASSGRRSASGGLLTSSSTKSNGISSLRPFRFSGEEKPAKSSRSVSSGSQIKSQLAIKGSLPLSSCGHEMDECAGSTADARQACWHLCKGGKGGRTALLVRTVTRYAPDRLCLSRARGMGDRRSEKCITHW